MTKKYITVVWLCTRPNLIANVCSMVRTKLSSAVFMRWCVCIYMYACVAVTTRAQHFTSVTHTLTTTGGYGTERHDRYARGGRSATLPPNLKFCSVPPRHISLVSAMPWLHSLIYFGMTITRAENVCLTQRSTELIASAENTSYGFIWPLYVGVQSVRSRIETEAELDSWT